MNQQAAILKSTVPQAHMKQNIHGEGELLVQANRNVPEDNGDSVQKSITGTLKFIGYSHGGTVTFTST